MRNDSENVLCTDSLKVIEPDLEEVCENYEDRSEYPDRQFQE